MLVVRRGCARSLAGERGERGIEEAGRAPCKEGSCGRGLSSPVGEHGGVERFANGSVSKRSL